LDRVVPKPLTATDGVTEPSKSEITGHAIAGIGQNLIFGLWSTYMLVFLTDVFGIGGGVAGLIIMCTRIWDAGYDLIMGGIADLTRTRWGRYRPWLLFMAVPVVLCLVLNFSTPDFSMTGKIVYASIAYVLMSMAFTSVDVPYWTLPTAMTRNVDKRTVIYSLSRISTTLAMLAANIAVIPLVNLFGKGNLAEGYRMTALAIGVCGAILYLAGFRMLREHVTLPPKDKFRLKEAAQVILKNKPLLMVLISMLFANGMYFLSNNMLIYYVQYNLGSRELVPLFTLLSLPGILLGMVLSPWLSKRFGQKTTFICVLLFGAAVNILFFFAGYSNLAVVMAFYAASSISLGSAIVLISALVANTIEYAEWKTGQRREGLITSTKTFVSKLCAGLGGGLTGLLLSLVHYTPHVAQSDSALSVFHMTMTLFLAIGMLVAVVPMLFYELTAKRHAEIIDELKNRQQAG